jgi:chromosome segregation ATPase
VQDCERIAGLESEIQSRKRNMQSQRQVIENVKQVQMRLRENIKGLEKIESKSTETLLKRYLTDLNKQEDQLVAANKAIGGSEDEIFNREQMLNSVRAKVEKDCEAATEKIRAVMQ